MVGGNKVITGKLLRDAFISGANGIANNKKAVDELNVFPVPDGDTGTNMAMTTSNAVAELKHLKDDCTAAEAAKTMAAGCLRGARGNSGVITSLIFRGFSKALKGEDKCDSETLVKALEMGVEGAYKSVMKPTEGTILTVAREASEKGREIARTTNDPVLIWEEVCKAAAVSLENTPKLLPVLAKAGVVDAGGKGLVFIFEAMLHTFKTGEVLENDAEKEEPVVTVETFADTVGKFDSEITFTYCTEMLITKKKDCADPSKLRAYLETIGDCVVVVDDDEIIKVHVHTNDPGLAIQKGLEFGYINLPKIENMKLQHENAKKQVDTPEFKPVKPDKKYGFVTVAAGKGIENMFADLGADCIVKGGQTMNPSTDDILKAIFACPAKNVFVLPNNKNIIMAAEQAVKLADRTVCVLQTRTIPQGMSAMLAFDPDADFNVNRTEMTKALERVSTGMVTFAARDSNFEGHAIKQGEILCLENGKLSFVEKDLAKGAYKLTKKLVKGDSSFITVIYGSDVTDDAAEALVEHLSAKYPGIDINLISGGQPVYYYIISVE